jgi:hypothetical protein
VGGDDLPRGIQLVLVRIGLALLTAVELTVGLWNQVLPESFYNDFPTVSLDPPFSEHYARDFGGATLGIAAVLLIAFIRPRPRFVGIAALAYSLFAVPHFVFHSLHLEHATGAESAFLTIGNAAVALIGLLLGIWSVARMRNERAVADAT